MSFPKYSNYEDVRASGVNKKPEHWRALRLRFATNLNPSKQEAKEFGKQEIVTFLPMEAIGEDGTLHLGQEKEIGECLSGYTYFRDGDVCIAKITPCFENGKGAILRGLKSGIGFGTTELIVVRPVEGVVTSEFLDYLFRSQVFRMLGESKMYGAGGQKRVPDLFVRDFIALIPPTDEQNQITDFLDRETTKIDALITEQERLIELLQEKRQAVISHAVTKGLDPNATTKDSGVEWLGEVPKHWEVVRLKNTFSIKHGFAFDGSLFADNGEYILMTPGNFREDGGFRSKDPEKYYIGNDIKQEYILNAGDLIIAMTEQAPGLIGSALFTPSVGTYLHNQRLGLISSSERSITEFIYWLMNSKAIKEKVGITSTGQKVRHTSTPKILSIKVGFPPKEEQLTISSYLQKKTSELSELCVSSSKAIELLKERRSSLISEAVTGQIDVRGLMPEEEAA